MEIKTEAMKRCELVTVSGRIDSITAPKLEDVLLGLIDTGQEELVVNLSGAEYISSAGLKALLSALMKITQDEYRQETSCSLKCSPNSRKALKWSASIGCSSSMTGTSRPSGASSSQFRATRVCESTPD